MTEQGNKFLEISKQFHQQLITTVEVYRQLGKHKVDMSDFDEAGYAELSEVGNKVDVLMDILNGDIE